MSKEKQPNHPLRRATVDEVKKVNKKGMKRLHETLKALKDR